MRVREHVCPGRAHPPREQWRDLGAIGALEGKDKPPRGGVIAQGGAGAVEYRVVTDACAADGVVATAVANSNGVPQVAQSDPAMKLRFDQQGAHIPP